MVSVEDIFQTVTEHIQLSRGILLLRTHGKSPEIEGEQCNTLQFIVLYFQYFTTIIQQVVSFSRTTAVFLARLNTGRCIALTIAIMLHLLEKVKILFENNLQIKI